MRLRNTNIIITLTLVIALFTTCTMGKRLHKGDKVNEWSVDYHLVYNNRTKNHVPDIIFAVIYKPKSKLQYVYFFYLRQDLVEKANGFDKRKFPRYTLLLASNQEGKIPDIVKLTSIDSAVFTKVKYLSDSLQTKSYSYLKNTIGFKQLKQ